MSLELNLVLWGYGGEVWSDEVITVGLAWKDLPPLQAHPLMLLSSLAQAAVLHWAEVYQAIQPWSPPITSIHCEPK